MGVDRQPAYTRSRSAFVAISDSDRYPGLDYAATIHHGIDLRMLPYRDRRGDYLVSLGRIHPDKGTADAIEIARRAGRRLVICGIVQDERYFADAVEPHVDGDQVIFLGSVGPRRRADVLGDAAAVALLLSGRRQEPPPQAGVAGEGGVVGRRDHLAEQVGGGGGPCPGQQATVRFRQRPLEVSGLELGGEGMQDGFGEFIDTALVG